LPVIQKLSRSFALRISPKQFLPRWQYASGPKCSVLCYHRIGSGGVPLYSALPPEIFEAQVRFLQEHYRIVSLDELFASIQNPVSLEQAVTITFDDGYRDLYTQAFPILQKYKIRATIYLTVGSIETGKAAWYDRIFVALKSFSGDQLNIILGRPRLFHLGSLEARIKAGVEIVGYLRTLPDQRRREWCASFETQIPISAEELSNCMLRWDQVKAMHQAGISFGSHTMTHPVFSRVPPPEMEQELLQSKQIIESKIGSPVKDFAYPFGQPSDCGSEDGELLVRCGYRTAVTTTNGVNVPGVNPYYLRRTQIGEERSLAIFVIKLNQLFFCGNGSEASKPSDMSAYQ